MSRKYEYKNGIVEIGDQRIEIFEQFISNIKEIKMQSSIDEVKRNFIQTKFIIVKTKNKKKYYNYFKNIFTKKMLLNDKRYYTNFENIYYSVKRKEGKIIRIDNPNNKELKITHIENEYLFSTILKLRSFWKFTIISYKVHTLSEYPISYYSLNNSVKKIWLKKIFKSTFKNIKKELKNIKAKLLKMSEEEILDFNFSNYYKYE